MSTEKSTENSELQAAWSAQDLHTSCGPCCLCNASSCPASPCQSQAARSSLDLCSNTTVAPGKAHFLAEKWTEPAWPSCQKRGI